MDRHVGLAGLIGAAVAATATWLVIEIALAPEVEQIHIEARWEPFEKTYGMCA